MTQNASFPVVLDASAHPSHMMTAVSWQNVTSWLY